MCQDLRAIYCNASSLDPGVTYEKCEVTCCEQNRCNGLTDSVPVKTNTTGTPPIPTNGAIEYKKVVFFATTFTSALYVLFLCTDFEQGSL